MLHFLTGVDIFSLAAPYSEQLAVLTTNYNEYFYRYAKMAGAYGEILCVLVTFLPVATDYVVLFACVTSLCSLVVLACFQSEVLVLTLLDEYVW